MDTILPIAADVGNDSMKLAIGNTELTAPSAITTLNSNLAPKEFDTKDELTTYMNDFLDHLQVSISSPAVKHLTNRYAVGQSAINSHLPLQTFDINSTSDKSTDDLAFVLLFSLIGGQIIKDYYNAAHQLPTSLEQEIVMTTALPINEGKKPGVKNHYAEVFTNNSHIVTFHNFANPISVRLTFKRVYVGLEGQVAQVALSNADTVFPDLANSLFNDLVNNYQGFEGATSKEVLSAPNIVLLDVGGKTVDISVLSNGEINEDRSISLMYGYDNVLQDSVDTLLTMNRNFENGQNLADYLRQTPSIFDKQSYNVAKEVVADQSESLKTAIANGLSKALGHSGIIPSLVILAGGGSIGLMNDTDLRQSLSDVTKNFNGGLAIPVLYVGDSSAQGLNMKGLLLILQELVKKYESGELL